jgi:O-antigen/teichoic acid export membrane protein
MQTLEATSTTAETGPIRRAIALGYRIGVLCVSTALEAIVGLCLTPLITRFVDPGVWGGFQLSQRVMNFGHSVVLPGLNESAVQSAAKSFHGNFRVLRKKKFRVALWAGAGVCGIGLCYLIMGETQIALMILAGAAVFPWISMFSGLPEAWGSGSGEIKLIAKMRIIRTIAGLVVVLGIILTPADWRYCLWPLAGMLISGYLVCKLIEKNVSNNDINVNFQNIGERMTWARIVNGLLLSTEFLIIERVLGAGITGVAGWGAALTLSQYFKVFLGNVQISITKRLYDSSPLREKLADVLPWTRLYFVAMLVISVPIFLFGAQLVVVYFGERWAASANVGVVLLLTVIVISVTDFYGAIMLAEQDVLYNNTIFLVAGVTMPLLTWAGAEWGGIYGLAVSRIVWNALSVLTRMAFMIRHMRAVKA